MDLAHIMQKELSQMRLILNRSLLGFLASMDPAWWRNIFAFMIAGAPIPHEFGHAELCDLLCGGTTLSHTKAPGLVALAMAAGEVTAEQDHTSIVCPTYAIVLSAHFWPGMMQGTHALAEEALGTTADKVPGRSLDGVSPVALRESSHDTIGNLPIQHADQKTCQERANVSNYLNRC